jgi:hypothetical protein
MSKREKIIVGVMILAVILGGLNFFGKSPVRMIAGNQNDGKELNKFIAKTIEQLNRSEQDVSGYILKAAALPLHTDPFLQMQGVAVTVPEAGRSAAKKTDDRKLRYWGYLQAGRKQYAIINGIEYEKNDRIEPQGYIVQQITPAEVMLESPEREQIVLSIEE